MTIKVHVWREVMSADATSQKHPWHAELADTTDRLIPREIWSVPVTKVLISENAATHAEAITLGEQFMADFNRA